MRALLLLLFFFFFSPLKHNEARNERFLKIAFRFIFRVFKVLTFDMQFDALLSDHGYAHIERRRRRRRRREDDDERDQRAAGRTNRKKREKNGYYRSAS
jgi:hypothetical protein